MAKTSGVARAIWRLGIWVSATLAVVVGAAGSWWVITRRHRPASNAQACQSVVEEEWVRAGRECLHFEEYRSPSLTEHPDLVVVLHGDAPFTRPGYQYTVARRLSNEVANIIAIRLLRPGYTDDDGHRSSGVRGRAIGDNYTAADVDAVTSAVTALVDTYLPGRVFLVGHSGGAALVADMIARHPGIAVGVVLVLSVRRAGVAPAHGLRAARSDLAVPRPQPVPAGPGAAGRRPHVRSRRRGVGRSCHATRVQSAVCPAPDGQGHTRRPGRAQGGRSRYPARSRVLREITSALGAAPGS